MHQAQWSPERPLPPPVSLASPSHHEKPPEVTCTSRGKPGFPASTRESPRETSFNTSRGQMGLTAYLTRGRERGQSFLGQTQRPAWISRFIFSEANYISEMALNLLDDRKRMFQFIGHATALEKLPPHEWLWYSVDTDTLRHFLPIPIDTAEQSA